MELLLFIVLIVICSIVCGLLCKQRWLVTKHRDKEALNVLCKIQSSKDKVEAFFNLETLQKARDNKQIVQNSFSLFMKRKYICRQVTKL